MAHEEVHHLLGDAAGRADRAEILACRVRAEPAAARVIGEDSSLVAVGAERLARRDDGEYRRRTMHITTRCSVYQQQPGQLRKQGDFCLLPVLLDLASPPHERDRLVQEEVSPCPLLGLSGTARGREQAHPIQRPIALRGSLVRLLPKPGGADHGPRLFGRCRAGPVVAVVHRPLRRLHRVIGDELCDLRQVFREPAEAGQRPVVRSPLPMFLGPLAVEERNHDRRVDVGRLIPPLASYYAFDEGAIGLDRAGFLPAPGHVPAPTVDRQRERRPAGLNSSDNGSVQRRGRRYEGLCQRHAAERYTFRFGVNPYRDLFDRNNADFVFEESDNHPLRRTRQHTQDRQNVGQTRPCCRPGTKYAASLSSAARAYTL